MDNIQISLYDTEKATARQLASEKSGCCTFNLSGTAANGWAAVIHKVKGFLKVSKLALCLFGYGCQGNRVCRPVADTAVILTTML